jgi:hypothetical protein
MGSLSERSGVFSGGVFNLNTGKLKDKNRMLSHDKFYIFEKHIYKLSRFKFRLACKSLIKI